MFQKLRSKSSLALFALFAGGILLFPELAFAQAEDDVLESFAKILSLIVKFLTFIDMFIIWAFGELLGSNLILGEDAMKGLQPMWVFMRNIVNLGFVLVIIYLAFANLVSSAGGQGGNWTIKEKLPRLIFALVAVNFSLLGFRVMVQFVDVGTVAILSIADTALGDRTPQAVLSEVEDTFNQVNLYKDSDASCNEGKWENECYYFQIKAEGAAGLEMTRNIMIPFAVYFLKIEELPKLASDLDSVSKVIDSTLFSAVMAIAYSMALIAMFIVMLFRLAAMWFFIIFSPVIVAGSIMGIGAVDEAWKKFITYLLVPLKIAAVFGISFVMMAALHKFDGAQVVPALSGPWLKAGGPIKQFMGDGGNLFRIVWQFLTIAIFWVGAFAALKGTEADSIIEGIKSSSQKLGGFALKSATVDRANIAIPTGNGDEKKNISLAALPKIGQGLIANRDARVQNEYQDLRSILPGANKESIKAIGKVETAIRDNSEGSVDRQDELIKVVGDLEAKDLNNKEAATKFANSVKLKDNVKPEAFAASLAAANASQIPQLIRDNTNVDGGVTLAQIKFKESSEANDGLGNTPDNYQTTVNTQSNNNIKVEMASGGANRSLDNNFNFSKGANLETSVNNINNAISSISNSPEVIAELNRSKSDIFTAMGSAEQASSYSFKKDGAGVKLTKN